MATLLGGAADALPAYASTGSIRPAAETAELAIRLREEGFRALKLRVEPPAFEDGLARVAAVRDAVGDEMEVMVDLNQGWRMPGDVTPPAPYGDVRRFADGLAAYGVRWLEEPLHGEDVSGLARLRDETAVPLAGGEMARTPALLDAYLEAGALDVLQPDAVLAVGIARARDLPRNALGQGLVFTPHTWTNGIGLLANLHLTAGVGGGPFLEYPYDPPGWTPERRDFMLAAPTVPDADGYLAVPDASGLGIELA